MYKSNYNNLRAHFECEFHKFDDFEGNEINFIHTATYANAWFWIQLANFPQSDS